MKVTIVNEVTSLSDGEYTGIIRNVFEFQKNGNPQIGIEFAIDDDTHTVFTKFYDEPERRLGMFPWNTVFRALDSDDTNDLIGQNVTFQIVNQNKNGKEYSNIKSIALL